MTKLGCCAGTSLAEALADLDGMPPLHFGRSCVSFDGFRFKNYDDLLKHLDSATVAQYKEVNLADGRFDKFGRQAVEVSNTSNSQTHQT